MNQIIADLINAHNAPVIVQMWDVPTDSVPVKIENVRPGMFVFKNGEYFRVTEFPVTTTAGVSVSLLGEHLGPFPIGSEVCVYSGE